MYYVIGKAGRKLVSVIDTDDMVIDEINEGELSCMIATGQVVIENMYTDGKKLLTRQGYLPFENYGRSYIKESKDLTYCLYGYCVDELNNIIALNVIGSNKKHTILKPSMIETAYRKFINIPFSYKIKDLFNSNLIMYKYQYSSKHPLLRIVESKYTWYNMFQNYRGTMTYNDIIETGTMEYTEVFKLPTITRKITIFKEEIEVINETTVKYAELGMKNKEKICTIDKSTPIKKVYTNVFGIQNRVKEEHTKLIAIKEEYLYVKVENDFLELAPKDSNCILVENNKYYIIYKDKFNNTTLVIYDAENKKIGIRTEIKIGFPSKVLFDENSIYMVEIYNKYKYDSETYSDIVKLDKSTQEYTLAREKEGKYIGITENNNSFIVQPTYNCELREVEISSIFK